MKKLTQEEFIEKAKKAHPDYDYSISKYTNYHSEFSFICPKHGVQTQLAYNHILYGCRQCGIERSKDKRKKSTEEEIELFRKVHGNRYDYSKVKYINIDTPVEIICPEHGSFWQSPYEHQNGADCPRCCGKNKTKEDFIKEAIEVHGGELYDYSEVEYVNSTTKVKIICPKHGPFWQTPANHLSLASMCPFCAKGCSKGELKVRNCLEKLELEYVPQKTFEGLSDKYPLRFDFYLPKYNTVIEFDGIQHFKPTDFGGGKAYENLSYNRRHDRMKEEYCKKNGINIIRISHEEYFDIEKKIMEGVMMAVVL